MKFKLPVLLAALIVALPASRAESSPEAFKAMQAALQYRAEMATTVAKKGEDPGSALKRLQERGGASGMTLSGDADVGYAALDIGQRLLSLKRPEAAEVFFRASEQAFERAANQASRAQAREKSKYLQKLATVRATYLNKGAQAKADINEAVRLQPADKSLKEAQSRLARGRPETFKEAAKNGEARP